MGAASRWEGFAVGGASAPTLSSQIADNSLLAREKSLGAQAPPTKAERCEVVAFAVVGGDCRNPHRDRTEGHRG
ncbi:DUF6053 domain-containing protein [Lysobacter enzymogenes]|uniref:DUF6053 domain-containing protein n=1 Tax=Lysobacter enzymogenes TaxID=69 RepID=UPI003CCD605A